MRTFSNIVLGLVYEGDAEFLTVPYVLRLIATNEILQSTSSSTWMFQKFDYASVEIFIIDNGSKLLLYDSEL